MQEVRKYNLYKIRKNLLRKHKISECRKRERYMEISEILGNIY